MSARLEASVAAMPFTDRSIWGASPGATDLPNYLVCDIMQTELLVVWERQREAVSHLRITRWPSLEPIRQYLQLHSPKPAPGLPLCNLLPNRSCQSCQDNLPF